MFANPNKKPVQIRRVAVPVKKDASQSSKPASLVTRAPAPAMRSLRDAYANLPSPSRPKARPSPIPTTLRSNASRKRKVASPALPTFDSDSSDTDSDGSLDSAIAPRDMKRARTGVLAEDSKRVLRDDIEWTDKSAKYYPIIHGRDLTTEDQAKHFRPAFSTAESEEESIVELQYPSRCPPEKFRLVLPLEKDGYNPIEDIEETIHTICQYYFPSAKAEEYTDDASGYRRRIRRAVDKNDLEAFKDTLKEFNILITSSLDSGVVQSTLDGMHTMPLHWVERIINQTYSRTVSPKVHILKHYENGSDDVYGEILPRFAHEIFQNTGLKSDQVFVDLGSGVGNVALQAALQCGCESFGIEKMDNPAGLAKAQKIEFEARCKRWGIKPGKVHLLHSSFLISPEIDAAMKRCSSILVNNKAFSPSLNDSLLYKFLDLKNGCRIVSLKSFVPPNWKTHARNDQDPRNLLQVKQMIYGTNSVSWTYDGGDYYLATKDDSKLKEYQNNQVALAARRKKREQVE